MVVKDVVHLVFMHIVKWVSYRPVFASIKVNGVLFNWEASLLSNACERGG